MLIKDTIVDNTVALPQSADSNLEQQGISVTKPNRQQRHIHNIHIQPRSSFCTGNNASIAHLFSYKEMSLLVGYINAHLSRRDTSTNEEERVEQLAVEIDTADYTILSWNEATLLPINGRSTSPEITFASSAIALLSDWSVTTSLASDHMTIRITIIFELSTIDGPRRTCINLKNVDWARYAEACDEYLADAGEKSREDLQENTE